MAALDTNRDLVRRHLLEGVSGHNVDIYDQIMVPDYRLHVTMQRDFLKGGRTGYKRGLERFWRAFPDMRIELLDLVAEGDRVVAHYIERGTNTGEWNGAAPTGRVYEKHGFAMYTVRGGQLVEAWVQEDQAGFARQLGLG